MAFTYHESQLADSPLFRVRMKLQDTNENDPQLQDEEILLLIDQNGSEDGAVRAGAMVIAARYSRRADKWVGDLKILESQKARAYRELAKSLSARSMVTGIPSAGGIRTAEKEAAAADSSLEQPHFFRGQHDNLED